jgi:hypothetical protein
MDQIKNLIGGLSLKQRIQIVVVAALVVAGVVAFVHYRHESDFRPLYTGMAPEDAAPVVQKLREAGVEYRLRKSWRNRGSPWPPRACPRAAASVSNCSIKPTSAPPSSSSISTISALWKASWNAP